MVMKAEKLYYKKCHLAGRDYHDADEVWNDLHVGTKLELVRDFDNRYDPNAVAVVYLKCYENGEKETFLLGYIPRDENELISQLLEMGWTDVFECRISHLLPDAYPEHQVYLTIRIKRCEK